MTHINKIKYFGFLSILMAFVFLIMVSCLSPLKNDTGTLIISIPETDSGNARSAALPAEMIQEMNYSIVFRKDGDNGNDKPKTIKLQKNKRETTVELVEGAWNIEVIAFYSGSEIAAIGSCDTKIIAGRTSYASVTMKVTDDFVTPDFNGGSYDDAVYWLGEVTDEIMVEGTSVNYGNLSYQWYMNDIDSNESETAVLVGNADELSFSPPSTNPGVFYYFPVATNTYPGKEVEETVSVTGNTTKITILERNSEMLQQVIDAAKQGAVIEIPCSLDGSMDFTMFSTVTIDKEITLTTKGTGDANLIRDASFYDTDSTPSCYLFTINAGGKLNLAGAADRMLNLDGNGYTTASLSNRSSLINVNGGILEMGDEVYLFGNTISSGGNNGSNGGAVTVTGSGSLFIMNGGEILYNTAVRGGGVYAANGANFVMNGGAIYSNYGTRNNAQDAGGGGVYITGNGTEFTMNGGIIGSETDGDGNEAYYNGGGVAVLNGAKFTMGGDAKIKNNYENGGSNTGGGGVAIMGTNSNFTMNEGAEISYNRSYTGGGVAVDAPMDSTNPPAYSFIMNGGKINHNTAVYQGSGNGGGPGGGVRVHDGSSFLMKDGEISYNETESYGGGVALNRGVFTMEGGSISFNKAPSNWGGGVVLTAYNSGDKTVFTMTGGCVEDNESGENGGGVYVDEDCEFIIGGTAEICRNTSNIDGGGVFISHSYSGGTGGVLNLQGAAKIYENHADGSGGGVCLDPSLYFSTAFFKIFSPATEESVFDNTAGVTPLPSQVYVISGTFLVDDSQRTSY